MIHIRIKGEVDTIKHVLLTVLRQCFFCGPFLLFMFHICLCYSVLSVPCSLVVTCWDRAGLSALLCVICTCVLSLSHHSVPDQVWNLILSIPDLCIFLYFNSSSWVFEESMLIHVNDSQI